MTEEQNQSEWQAPPPPEKINAAELAQMSEAGTLAGIFFEPGKTFEDLRRKPRFLLAGLIVLLAITIFNAAFIQKVGYERIVRERMESNPRIQQLPKEQQEQIIESQNKPVWKVIGYAAPPVVVIIIFLLGGLIYWLGSSAMGGTARFSQGLSVWIYSSLPPALIFMVANLLVLFLKSLDEIDITQAQRGLVQANPSMLIDAKAHGILAALLSSLDLFGIWGWVLAAIGLQKVAKISSGSAWAIVLILGLAGVAAKVIIALAFGS